ncbi:uncharacterized protein [Mobula birostris]|uniref:uncharacterized protein n=1 Tax=Mobula birostris TaxID=1983395 RepID=UPI003B27D829
MSRAVAGVGGMCPTIKPGTNRGTQRILDRMDDSKTYLTVTFTKMDSWTASRLEPDVSYADINFKTGSRPRVRTDRAGLNSTYSELNFRKEEHRIDEDEDPPITSGPGGLPTTDKTGNMGNERPATRDRSDSRTWLICVLTTALVITGICWWIHANYAGVNLSSERRESYWMDDSETYVNLKFTRTDSPSPSRELRSQRIFHRTDDSETSGNEKFTKTDSRSPSRGLQEQESKENIGNRPYRKICLLCTVTSICFAIVTGLSIHVSQIRQSLITCERDHQEFWEQYQEMNRTQQECRLQITDIEIKYRTLTKAKAQICQLLTSRKVWNEFRLCGSETA